MYSCRNLISKLRCFDLNLTTSPIETMPTTPPPCSRRPGAGLAGLDGALQAEGPPVYTLMDQLWLSPALAEKQTGAFIERRSKVSGDGSDHDPAWVTLEL